MDPNLLNILVHETYNNFTANSWSPSRLWILQFEEHLCPKQGQTVSNRAAHFKDEP